MELLCRIYLIVALYHDLIPRSVIAAYSSFYFFRSPPRGALSFLLIEKKQKIKAWI